MALTIEFNVTELRSRTRLERVAGELVYGSDNEGWAVVVQLIVNRPSGNGDPRRSITCVDAERFRESHTPGRRKFSPVITNVQIARWVWTEDVEIDLLFLPPP